MLVQKCSQCGKENSNDSVFCNYCGCKLINHEQNIQPPFADTSNDEMDREFLLANVQDIMRLHYISRNFDENIKALQTKNDNLKEVEFGIKPKPPIPPNRYNNDKNSGGYTDYEVIMPFKDIIQDYIGALIYLFFLLPIVIIVATCMTVSRIIKNKKIPALNQKIYEKNLAEYQRLLDKYNEQKEKIELENNKINSVARPNLAKAIDTLSEQQKEALSLLDECYSLNIIPSKYRNIYAITFICDYLSTSQGSLRDALFACDLDKIQSQLATVIENQTTMISKLAKIEANTGKMLQQQEQMLSHLERIEKNTYDTARATEQCAQYNKIIAHNTKVMAYCEAMTYIDSRDILDFDPYSPTTIKDFGLEKFSSYYKN